MPLDAEGGPEDTKWVMPDEVGPSPPAGSLGNSCAMAWCRSAVSQPIAIGRGLGRWG